MMEVRDRDIARTVGDAYLWLGLISELLHDAENITRAPLAAYRDAVEIRKGLLKDIENDIKTMALTRVEKAKALLDKKLESQHLEAPT